MQGEFRCWLIALGTLTVGCGGWSVTELKSEMGDATMYSVKRSSSTTLHRPKSLIAPELDYKPELAVRYDRGRLFVRLILQEDFKCTRASGCDAPVRVRFDEGDAFPVYNALDDTYRNVLVLGGSVDLVSQMLKHKTIKVEFPVYRGPAVAQFELAGLQEQLVGLCEKANEPCDDPQRNQLAPVLASVGVSVASNHATAEAK